MPTSSALLASRLLAFSRRGSVAVAIIGVVALLGWHFNLGILRTGLPGLITMKANTALGFLAAGLSLRLSQPNAAKGKSRLALALSILVLAIGGLTLCEYFFPIDFGIDQLLYTDDPSHPGVTLHGRMSPVTALSFCLFAASLLLLGHGGERGRRGALWCSVAVMLFAIQAVIGYAYGVQSLYQVKPFSALALNTALAFLILSLSILASAPTLGFMKIVTSETAGGFVVRRFLPIVPAGLFLFGWARLAGEEAGWYDGRFGLALMVLLAMAFTAVIVLWIAGVLYRVDLRRSGAEEEVVALNAGLERKVQERTRELQQALTEVKQLSGLLPICAWCKKIRDDKNYWQTVEGYIAARTDATFSHGVCPPCFAKMQTDDLASR